MTENNLNDAQKPHVPPVAGVQRILLPNAPVLVQDGQKFCALTLDGEIEQLTVDQARQLVRQHMPITCHAPQIARRLGMERFPAYDVLELFAFVHPARFCVPTPRGLTRALSLMEGETAEDQCLNLRDCIRHLLGDLMAEGRGDTSGEAKKSDPAAIAAMMGLMSLGNTGNAAESGMGWSWTPMVLAALGRDSAKPTWNEIRASLRIWDKLPEWSVHAPEPSAGQHGVSASEATDRLHKMLVRQKKEDRPEQQAYASALTDAFAPRNAANETRVVMAEAGTGTGKTLGYLAPASVWAEKNEGAVWISTYTRNLQKQVEAELEKLYDDPVTHARKVVTRKGRENYLCLLNLEDATQSQTVLGNELNATALGLMLRWAGKSADGDMSGRDFPGWLPGLMGWNRIYNFADRRGECIYAACPHFDKCFVEKSVRKSRRADIVIANHALVMHQAALAGADDEMPSRYIFDEGHHIFEAADSAFDSQLNGTWTADLRRWILGVETGHKTRARGVKKRLEDLISDDDGAKRDVEDLLQAAQVLPAPQWRQRLSEGAPKGATEEFLLLCLRQVLARNKDAPSFYSLECDTVPAIPGLTEAAAKLAQKLADLQRPMLSLFSRLQKRLSDEAEELDSAMRERIRYVSTSLYRRAHYVVTPWIAMLHDAGKTTPEDSVDWLELTRIEGRDDDAGFYRYYVDPAKVFAEQLKPHAHGVVMTSATLRDISPDDDRGWQSPQARAGVAPLTTDSPPASLFHVSSPFDYKKQTRIFVIRDVDKNSTDEAAAAFRALFTAAGGGALGIFTSVQRLKMVQAKIAAPLESSGLHLYAQHVDPLDTGTLIDIFREEENACLLGTDATRDGIDVPGRSLRLVVYDRVPWPKPTILHKARRNHFGKSYDDMLTRFKLKQAYGRLIRRSDDRGVFVMLDGALPTRLTSAFPEGVEIERVGLAEAVQKLKEFL